MQKCPELGGSDIWGLGAIYFLLCDTGLRTKV